MNDIYIRNIEDGINMKKSELRQIIREEIKKEFLNKRRLTEFWSKPNKQQAEFFKKNIIPKIDIIAKTIYQLIKSNKIKVHETISEPGNPFKYGDYAVSESWNAIENVLDKIFSNSPEWNDMKDKWEDDFPGEGIDIDEFIDQVLELAKKKKLIRLEW